MPSAAIGRARNTLAREKARLESELSEVTRALEALDGRPKKASSKPDENLTCEDCGFGAKGRQGLAAHRRVHRSKSR